jgi:hypothetical protein
MGWKDQESMMPRARCADCRFWHRLGEENGECRRYPPAIGDKTGSRNAAWPTTFDDDWCGEWKPDVPLNRLFAVLKDGE